MGKAISKESYFLIERLDPEINVWKGFSLPIDTIEGVKRVIGMIANNGDGLINFFDPSYRLVKVTVKKEVVEWKTK